MNDDIFKKLKTLLTGSELQSTGSIETEKVLDEELINNVMNQILDTAWIEEDLKSMCLPSYHLSTKEKSYWLMNTTLKSMFNIKGGIEIIPIENGKPNTQCLIGQSIFSVPNELIICLGWN